MWSRVRVVFWVVVEEILFLVFFGEVLVSFVVGRRLEVVFLFSNFILCFIF